MDEIVEKNKCCGCHACANICPKGAITMIEDKKGFLYPKINKEKCVNCNLCKSVCPILNSKEQEKKIIAYACYNKNIEERLNSSSGGIFILLAKEIIKKNGVVFGASFDANFNIVHSYVESESELKKFMGSKYTQSIIGSTYKKAKELLESDRYVLFTGTPCQIEGLKSYLKKEYDKLYTQDIICHGVPSPKAWQKYLEYQKKTNREQIKSISFRNKDQGWSKYHLKISFDNKEYSQNLKHDMYLRAFLKNICLRDSCYNCSFKKKYRISDITLADFWGINRVNPSMNDDKGISLVIVNSKKGEELFELVKSSIEFSEVNLDDAIKFNPALIRSANHSVNEKEFADNLDSMDFDKLVDKFVPKPSLFKKIINKIKSVVKRIIGR